MSHDNSLEGCKHLHFRLHSDQPIGPLNLMNKMNSCEWKGYLKHHVLIAQVTSHRQSDEVWITDFYLLALENGLAEEVRVDESLLVKLHDPVDFNLINFGNQVD